MFNDAQTHLLPAREEEFERLACFMGRDARQLRKELFDRLTEVHDLTEGFFAPDAGPATPSADREIDQEEKAITSRWRSYAALRSERAIAIFERLRPEILNRLRQSTRPHEALVAFDGFLSGLPAGVQLFSLFEANPHLIDLLVDIVGTAPALARHLSRHALVFDAVIGGDFFSAWPGVDALQAELSAHLDQEGDYENRLDNARRWAKEWHFRIGVHLLRDLISAEEGGRQYADLAEACLRALWPVVVGQFATKHGDPPGRGAVVLGMGSLGAARLNATSDLDLIVIYDADGVEISEGRRPLMARQYYARLTQALVTAITAQMAEGRLYEVDMRLRPSGNQGPVATSWPGFQSYQTEEAWIWEHLALTRARPVAGNAPLADDIETFRQSLLGQKSLRDAVLQEVAQMRARIAAAKSPDGPWDAKLGPGRLQDIELIAQAGTLLCGERARSVASGLRAAVACGLLDDASGTALIRAYELCWQVQLASKLLSEKPLNDENIGQGGGGVPVASDRR